LGAAYPKLMLSLMSGGLEMQFRRNFLAVEEQQKPSVFLLVLKKAIRYLFLFISFPIKG